MHGEQQSTGWLTEWWHQPDRFDWLNDYGQATGVSTAIRRTLAVITATLVLIPANALWGPAVIEHRLAVGIALVAAGAGVSVAALWWTRRPTRGQSLCYATVGSVSIAGGSLWQSNPVAGLLGCTALAVFGGYLAFFHTARLMTLNFALATVVGTVQTIRLTHSGQVVLALSCLLPVFELNIAVPLAIHILVSSLSRDLSRSDRDPLTNLLNRRALTAAAVGRLLTSPQHVVLTVALIDLDRFKHLNDSHGHAAGDKALITVAHALHGASGDTALIGRVGGEEFLVVDVIDALSPTDWANHLCGAVQAGAAPVTASIGTAALTVSDIDSAGAHETFRQLVAHADAAMYIAKRRGGNQTHHHGSQPPTTKPG